MNAEHYVDDYCYQDCYLGFIKYQSGRVKFLPLNSFHRYLVIPFHILDNECLGCVERVNLTSLIYIPLMPFK